MAGNEKTHLRASMGQAEVDAIALVAAVGGVVSQAPPVVTAGRSEGEAVGHSLMRNSGILENGTANGRPLEIVAGQV
jgi:hypothetical protein